MHNHKLPAHVTLLDDVSDVHEVWSLENVQWGSLINNLNDWNVFTLQGVNKDNWRTRNLKPKCGYDGEFYAIRQRKPVNRTSSISLFTLGGVILPKILSAFTKKRGSFCKSAYTVRNVNSSTRPRLERETRQKASMKLVKKKNVSHAGPFPITFHYENVLFYCNVRVCLRRHTTRKMLVSCFVNW